MPLRTRLIPRRELLGVAGLGAVTLAAPRFALGVPASDARPDLIIQRLNWAGVKLEAGDSALFIDATTSDPTSLEEKVAPATARPRSYALITHAHGDHFDASLLRALLGEKGYLVCHRDSVPFIDLRALRVSPVDLWEPVFIPRGGSDFVVFAVPAADGWGLPQVSWVIEAAGRRFIHCGDTLWHGRLTDIGLAYGPFDVAFLPVNGARQDVGRFKDQGVPGVLTPEQAVAAAQALRARLVVPIHYGNPSPPNYVEVARAEETFVGLARQKQVDVRPMRPGDSLPLS